ncbi:MAG: M3 family oligoendopeptidase [Rhodospirillales bacterium]|nr:M3 family oligoendopeptidase [Rhodospirillales bacterium]
MGRAGWRGSDDGARPGSGDGTDLPSWDLGDLYNGPDDPALDRDLGEASQKAIKFAEDYSGKLAGLGGPDFAQAIKQFEAVDETLSRALSYGQLLFAANTEDAETAAFYQNLSERATQISSGLLFFELEINRIDDDMMDGWLKNAEVLRYKPWLDANRVLKPHQLSDELEKFAHEKRVAGRAAWTRLFDETMAGLRFDVDGKRLTSSEIMDMMVDRKPSLRRKAAKSFGAGLGDNIRLFSMITNTLAKDKGIEDDWRHHASPISSRNLQNRVEDEVVDALIGAVKDAYPQISHRYYKLKARWLELDVMDYWDRNAPLPDADDSRLPWQAAQKTVLDAYAAFDPKLSEVAGRFFDNSWIDAKPRAGKDSGAFSHPTVPSAHPYILMNYHGKTRDVMTLAHELGHGVHQILAAPQGHFLSNTPLTLAETASVFGEMLTFRAMLAAAPDDRRRRVLLASKVEDMLNTVVRQVAFCDFEIRVHGARRSGEVSAERLGEIWLDVQRESLGPAFRFDEEYKNYWAYIPHFIHAPFYVYAYAFGDCLVNSLYGVFEGGHADFQSKYLDLLRAGGTLRHSELLAPFGLNAGDPSFWAKGLHVISGFVDDLEAALVNKDSGG